MKKLGKRIKGVVAGGIIFLISFPLLFWNEGRAVSRYKVLKEGAGLVISVPADKINPANQNRLVHAVGLAGTSEILTEGPPGSISANALKLRRTVQMYQWHERRNSKSEKKMSGGQENITSYSYEKKWSDSLIESSRFKNPQDHANPQTMPFQSITFSAKTVSLGAFQLPKNLVNKINKFEPLPVYTISSALPDWIQTQTKILGEGYYVGDDYRQPKIGDLKIGYSMIKPLKVTVVAQQIGNTFAPYVSKSGALLEEFRTGVYSAEDMFGKARSQNKMTAWMLRFVGFIIMVTGLSIALKPLSVVLDALPFLGHLAEKGIGLAAAIISAGFSLLTIAAAWLFYRPFLSISLIVIASGLIFGIKIKMLRQKKSMPPPLP